MLRRFLLLLLCCALLLPVGKLQAQDDVQDVPQDIPQDVTQDAPQDVPQGIPQDVPQDDPVTGILRQSLEGAEGGEAVHSLGELRFSSWPVLPKLYERHAYRPFWTSPDAVDQFVAAILGSYDEGLNPQDYHLREIVDLLDKYPAGKTTDPNLAASLDMLLTDSFIRLASHSMFGREDPATHHPQWKIGNAAGGGDPVDYFEKALEYPSITSVVDSWKVHYEYYGRLKKALAAYRAIRAQGGWQTLPDGKFLRMGDSGPRVLALRRRLAAEYPELGLSKDNPRFDGDLYKAVRYFQARHGLKQDGAAGRDAVEAMNVPVGDRINQIRINLERGRWVLRDLGDPFVLVDIAGFNVYMQEHGRIVWSGRAQVGQPFRDTPVLRSRITYVELNPTWTIPPTVRDQDVLPEVKKDLGYLKKHNIVIMDKEGYGFITPPKAVKWSLYPDEPFPYRLVQNPGDANPLGRIKIMFPNAYSVYLHDTPSKDLFDREQRTFSSGCIRVERPFELASLLLGDVNGWTADKLRRAGSDGKTWKIELLQPVTILVMYSTVIVDKNGVPFFRKDLYNRDPSMLEELGPDPVIVSGRI